MYLDFEGEGKCLDGCGDIDPRLFECVPGYAGCHGGKPRVNLRVRPAEQDASM